MRRKIFTLVKTFPPEEKYRWIDQMIRSSRSALIQMAEGYGRFIIMKIFNIVGQGRILCMN